MIEPNKGTSEIVLRRLKEGSEERFQLQLIESIRMLLDDFGMTWDDLAEGLSWRRGFIRIVVGMSGDQVREYIGRVTLTVEEINDIAHVFSMEPYIMFRPRKPHTQT